MEGGTQMHPRTIMQLFSPTCNYEETHEGETQMNPHAIVQLYSPTCNYVHPHAILFTHMQL